MLRSWPKLRPQNLEDLEGVVSVLDRVLIAIQDSGSGGELRDQNLSLTAKEKLPEEDIQAYKFWRVQNSEEDTFESLIQWLENKIQIMDEAKAEAGQISRRKNLKPSGKQDGKRDTPEVTARQVNRKSVLLKAVIKIIHHGRAKSLRSCQCLRKKRLLRALVVVSVV